MIDLTPLDVRKKRGDFRRTVRGYDPELVDDFLDMVAERLEELVKQNVSLTERAEHLQEQVGTFREREKALNEALVTAKQLRAESQAQADREAELVRREAQTQAERIIEEGHRSLREIARETEALVARRRQFLRSFRTLVERYMTELEVEEARARVESPEARLEEATSVAPSTEDEQPTSAVDEPLGDGTEEERPLLSPLASETEQEEQV